MKPFIVVSLSTLLLTGAAHAGNTLLVPKQFPTIQDAVDAAVTGDLIQIKPGNYRENVTVLTSGLTFAGTKAVVDGDYLGPSMSVTADDVKLSGLTFSNGGLEITGSGALVSKCRVRSSADVGFKLTGTGTIENCTISTCLGTGLVIVTGDPTGEVTTLNHNTIVHNGAGIDASDGPFEITHNVISNNSGDGLKLSFTGTATVTTGTDVSRNDMIANGGSGLVLADDLGAVTTLTKNDLLENGGKGLDLATSAGALQIDDNNINENHAGGVFLKTAGASFEDNHLVRNSLVGIVILSTGGATDGGNVLDGNSFETSGGDGVHIESGNNTVNKNVMKDNAGDGLQVATGADGNKLTSNITHDNAHDGLDNWGTNTLITGTKTFDNGGADLAGIGDGNGTVDPASVSNSSIDLTDLTSMQELELDTLATGP